MSDSLGKEFIKEVASGLLSAACGVTVDEVKRKGQDWTNAISVAKNDKKIIRQQFGTDNNMALMVGNFFKTKVAPTYKYYGSITFSVGCR